MGKKIQVSISLDEEFIAELDEFIEKYTLSSRSSHIQNWSRIGFEELKKRFGKREIAVAISKG